MELLLWHRYKNVNEKKKEEEKHNSVKRLNFKEENIKKTLIAFICTWNETYTQNNGIKRDESKELKNFS